jgi:membrane-bound serine protease (ClpP class)
MQHERAPTHDEGRDHRAVTAGTGRAGRTTTGSTARLWACLLLVLAALPALAQRAAGDVLLMTIEGTMGPVTAEYFRAGLREAEAVGASLVVVRLDTPGGLDTAMRDMVKDILASPLPVAVLVAPSGARAASAGTYLLYASHLAAMAPATNLGSATPVRIGGLPSLPDRADPPADGDNGSTDAEPPTGDAMERKIVNDAAAFIRGLARLRGRNAEWAEQAVRGGENLTAQEALEAGVIDLIAEDVSGLLDAADGRVVEVLGEPVVLRTAATQIVDFQPDLPTRILAVITNPTIAYVLMLIGIYGLIYELANPGAIIPGVIGTIALLTALFAFQALPVNYAGLALLAVGIGFMALEAFVPSFGALGIGGAVAFVIGSLILYQDDTGQFGVAIPVILTFTVLSAGMFIGVLAYTLKTRIRPVVSGAEELLHAVGVVEEDMQREGRVRVHSESWQARSTTPLRRGQRVRITAIDGLRLTVQPDNGVQQDD